MKNINIIVRLFSCFVNYKIDIFLTFSKRNKFCLKSIDGTFTTSDLQRLSLINQIAYIPRPISLDFLFEEKISN